VLENVNDFEVIGTLELLLANAAQVPDCSDASWTFTRDEQPEQILGQTASSASFKHLKAPGA
jgi:hypothetical protein